MANREELKARMAASSGKKAEPENKKIPDSRVGKIGFTIYCDPAVRTQVRQLALKQETTAQAIVLTALNEYFERNGEKPIG